MGSPHAHPVPKVSGAIEKRRHHRPMALLDVKVLLGGGGANQPDMKFATIDVAVGGMRCASNVPLDPGIRLRMKLDMVGGGLRQPATIVGDACVLRCSERQEQPEVRRWYARMLRERGSAADPARAEALERRADEQYRALGIEPY